MEWSFEIADIRLSMLCVRSLGNLYTKSRSLIRRKSAYIDSALTVIFEVSPDLAVSKPIQEPGRKSSSQGGATPMQIPDTSNHTY